ncbi:MlaD family protein [Vibrio sp.]|nr:MlaD family protein [Vibrio sp.]
MSQFEEQNTSASQSLKIKKKRLSPLWILPIISFILVGWLLFKSIADKGEVFKIYFDDAAGLTAGRTTIKYEGLEVGILNDVRLSDDLNGVYAEAEIYPNYAELFNKDTQFWLVQPSASLSGVSGLDALVSGNYVALQPGQSQEEPPAIFTALEKPPIELLAENGLYLTLKAKELNGLSAGSKIVYKTIPIGEVYDYELNIDTQEVIIQAFIDEEFKGLITDKSRFWNISGISADISAAGVQIEMQDFNAILQGAIAVDSPDSGYPITDDTQFKLYENIKTAGRGILVDIQLPEDSGINERGAPIMHRGIQVGQLTNVTFGEDRKHIVAQAAIEPIYHDLLTSGSAFVIEEAQVSAAGIENISNLIKGNHLSLYAGDGEAKREFTAIREREFKIKNANALGVTFYAKRSYGLESGTPITHRDIQIGAITAVKLTDDGVLFDGLIQNNFRHLMRSKNRFYINSSVSAEVTGLGLDVNVPPLKSLITSSVSFISEGEATDKTQFELYKSQSLAELAKYNQSGSISITLFADELPSITKHSPILYRNLKVGSVTEYYLKNNGVEITAQIDKQYKHLLTDDSVFWNASGIEIDASLTGVSIKAASAKTLLQGGLAFDDMDGISNKIGDSWKLYPSKSNAEKFGYVITLQAGIESGEVKVGTAIKYNNIQVGEVFNATPNFENGSVLVKAYIYPEYVQPIARKGSYFWLPSTELNISNLKNVSNLLSSSINVTPGDGQYTGHFDLNVKPAQAAGLNLVLQANERTSIKIGTPILYKGIDIGKVTEVKLGEYSDRVLFSIFVEKKYAHLIRQNTVFWNGSGIDISLGFSGAEVKSGTVDSIVRGGILIATPPTNELQPRADNEQLFKLYSESKETWEEWNTPIPRPE